MNALQITPKSNVVKYFNYSHFITATSDSGVSFLLDEATVAKRWPRGR